MTRLTRIYSSLIVAPALAAGIVLLSWGVSFVPLPWIEMVRDAQRFLFLVLLIWIVRRGLAYERELRQHRQEIVDSLNHKLGDLEHLKQTAEALERHNVKRAADLVEATKRVADQAVTAAKQLAEQVAEELRQRAEELAVTTKQIAEQAAEESRKRHVAIGIKLDQVIKDKQAANGESHRS